MLSFCSQHFTCEDDGVLTSATDKALSIFKLMEQQSGHETAALSLTLITLISIMAPKTKLTYFNGTGLGESIRFLLVYLDREYEDSRFEEEEWAKIKPSE
ncbi:transferase activity protein [Homalodisca vitripennis]|nr:transferase activity protein [Homalodisca vitripennis]